MPFDKQKAIELAYESEPSVLIVFRTDIPGTAIPEHLRGQEDVVLEIGQGLARPILDHRFDERGVSGTFSFGGVNHPVVVPWRAIVQVNAMRTPGRGESTVAVFMWPEDAQIAAQGGPDDGPEPDAPQGKGRGRLRSV